MTLRAPQPLAAGHRLETFDCGKASLNDWLLRHARQAQAAGSARTYIVTDDERAAGYFSLTVGQVDTLEAPDRMRKGMGQYPIPVVILARLAVDARDHGRGIGRGMLLEAVRRALVTADEAGIRALLTHPSGAEARAFYERYGFVRTPVRDGQLLLLLRDARAPARSASEPTA